ncbi:MAG TPA: hypothetical protein VJH23_03290 [archaeon]|nr:hypothetical protein [archaeon]
MVVFANVVDAAIVAYLVFGAGTWGYIFLRTGWPNIRQLEQSYKKGWSIAFGISFAATMAVIVGAAAYFMPQYGSVTELVLVGSPAVFISGIIVFSFKRRFLRRHGLTVSVPKRVVVASIAARRAMERIPTAMYVSAGQLALAGDSVSLDEDGGIQFETRQTRAAAQKKGAGMKAHDLESHKIEEPTTRMIETEKMFVEERSAPRARAPPAQAKAARGSTEKEISPLQERPREGAQALGTGNKEWAKPGAQTKPLSARQMHPAEKRSFFAGFFGQKKKPAQAPVQPSPAAKPIPAASAKPLPAAAKAYVPTRAEIEDAKKSITEAEREMEIIGRRITLKELALAEREAEEIRRELEAHDAARAKAAAVGAAAKKAAPAGGGIFSSFGKLFSKKSAAEPLPAKVRPAGTVHGEQPAAKPAQNLPAVIVKQKPSDAQNAKAGTAGTAKGPGKGWEGQKVLAPQKPPQKEPLGQRPASDQFEVKGGMDEQRMERLRRRLAEIEAQKATAQRSGFGGAMDAPRRISESFRQDMGGTRARKSTENILRILEKKSAEKTGQVISGEQARREAESSKEFIMESVREASFEEGAQAQPAAMTQEIERRRAEMVHAEEALPKSALLLKKLLKEESD